MIRPFHTPTIDEEQIRLLTEWLARSEDHREERRAKYRRILEARASLAVPVPHYAGRGPHPHLLKVTPR